MPSSWLDPEAGRRDGRGEAGGQVWAPKALSTLQWTGPKPAASGLHHHPYPWPFSPALWGGGLQQDPHVLAYWDWPHREPPDP